MKLEVFEKIVNLIDEQAMKSIKLAELGVDLINYDDTTSTIISLLLKAYYGKEGEEWISWYLFERASFGGGINKAWDKDGNEICYDVPSLWKCVEEIRCSNDFVEYELPNPTDDNFVVDIITSFLNRKI